MVDCINLFTELVENAKESTAPGSGLGQMLDPFKATEIEGYKDLKPTEKKKLRTEMKTREKTYKQNKATDYKRVLLQYMRNCGIPRDCAEGGKAVD